MGPHAEETGWSRYRTDAAFHNAYWISSWPRSEVGPSFLAPLLMQSATVRTFAVTIEPIPFAQAMRRAETAQTLEMAGEMERRRQGFMTTASDRRRAQAVTRREEELADGLAAMRFTGFVTVSARDAEELERPTERSNTPVNSAGWSSSGFTGSRRQRSPTRCRCPVDCAENSRSTDPSVAAAQNEPRAPPTVGQIPSGQPSVYLLLMVKLT
jgi:hypothetical protein